MNCGSLEPPFQKEQYSGKAQCDGKRKNKVGDDSITNAGPDTKQVGQDIGDCVNTRQPHDGNAVPRQAARRGRERLHPSIDDVNNVRPTPSAEGAVRCCSNPFNRSKTMATGEKQARLRQARLARLHERSDFEIVSAQCSQCGQTFLVRWPKRTTLTPSSCGAKPLCVQCMMRDTPQRPK